MQILDGYLLLQTGVKITRGELEHYLWMKQQFHMVLSHNKHLIERLSKYEKLKSAPNFEFITSEKLADL